MRQSKQLGLTFLGMVPLALMVGKVIPAMLFLVVGVMALSGKEK